MPERFWSLKACPLFEQLSDDEIVQLEQQCRSKAFLRGSLIDLPGPNASVIYLVVSGRIKIAHITEDGRESILAFMQPGEIFGELAVVDESGNEDFLEAMEKSMVLLIPVEVVRSLMERRIARAQERGQPRAARFRRGLRHDARQRVAFADSAVASGTGESHR